MIATPERPYRIAHALLNTPLILDENHKAIFFRDYLENRTQQAKNRTPIQLEEGEYHTEFRGFILQNAENYRTLLGALEDIENLGQQPRMPPRIKEILPLSAHLVKTLADELFMVAARCRVLAENPPEKAVAKWAENRGLDNSEETLASYQAHYERAYSECHTIGTTIRNRILPEIIDLAHSLKIKLTNPSVKSRQ